MEGEQGLPRGQGWRPWVPGCTSNGQVLPLLSIHPGLGTPALLGVGLSSGP